MPNRKLSKATPSNSKAKLQVSNSSKFNAKVSTATSTSNGKTPNMVYLKLRGRTVPRGTGVRPKRVKQPMMSLQELLKKGLELARYVTLAELEVIEESNKNSKYNGNLESNGRYERRPLHRSKLELHRQFVRYLSTAEVLDSFSIREMYKKFCRNTGKSRSRLSVPVNMYNGSFFFSYDLFLFMQFVIRPPCSILERIHSDLLGKKLHNQCSHHSFKFKRCTEYCQDFTDGSQFRNSMESNYKNSEGTTSKTWDYFAAQYNSTSESILVFPFVSMSSYKNKYLCYVPYPIFSSFLNVPPRKFYFIPIQVFCVGVAHCSVYRLDSLKRRIDVFDPIANRTSEDEFSLLKHAVTIADLLNKTEFQYAYKSRDTEGRFMERPSLSAKRLGNDKWVVGEILRDATLPFSFANTCLLNCLLFVDMHVPTEESLIRSREAKERVPSEERSHKAQTAEQKQRDQLRSIVFYSAKTVTHAEFEFFNICRKAPSKQLYCIECSKK